MPINSFPDIKIADGGSDERRDCDPTAALLSTQTVLCSDAEALDLQVKSGAKMLEHFVKCNVLYLTSDSFGAVHLA